MSDDQDLADEKETLRLEAFSDGVYAIAITLLVLELKVPHELRTSVTLAQALLEQRPTYVAFLVSFGTSGAPVAGSTHCENWTTTDAGSTAGVGFCDYLTDTWTQITSLVPCNYNTGHLYCFQQ